MTASRFQRLKRDGLVEDMRLEGIALALAVIGQLLFTRNESGQTAWSELGITSLLVAGILVAASWGYVATWIVVNAPIQHPQIMLWTITGIPFGFAGYNYWRRLPEVRLGKARLTDIFDDSVCGMFLLLGQIPLWLARPSLIRWLCRWAG